MLVSLGLLEGSGLGAGVTAGAAAGLGGTCGSCLLFHSRVGDTKAQQAVGLPAV